MRICSKIPSFLLIYAVVLQYMHKAFLCSWHNKNAGTYAAYTLESHGKLGTKINLEINRKKRGLKLIDEFLFRMPLHQPLLHVHAWHDPNNKGVKGGIVCLMGTTC